MQQADEAVDRASVVGLAAERARHIGGIFGRRMIGGAARVDHGFVFAVVLIGRRIDGKAGFRGGGGREINTFL